MQTGFLKYAAIFAVAFVYVQSQFYQTKEVKEIVESKKFIYQGSKLKTSCILNCQGDVECEKVIFKEKEGGMGPGKCWKLIKNAKEGDEGIQIQGKETILKTFEIDPLFCGTRSCCRSGVCQSLCGIDPVCHCGDWELQAANICFGARNNSYGEFQIHRNGTLTKLKLQHSKEGTLSCWTTESTKGSKWGCIADNDSIRTLITNNNNKVILPKNENATTKYILPGFHHNSPCVIFNDHIDVTIDDIFRIWYTEDLYNTSEDDNSGRSCADVYTVIE